MVRQVFEIKRIIERDISDLEPERVVKIRYEDLEIEKVRQIFHLFLDVDLRKGFSIDRVQFVPGNLRKLEEKKFFKIQNIINRISTEYN